MTGILYRILLYFKWLAWPDPESNNSHGTNFRQFHRESQGVIIVTLTPTSYRIRIYGTPELSMVSPELI